LSLTSGLGHAASTSLWVAVGVCAQLGEEEDAELGAEGSSEGGEMSPKVLNAAAGCHGPCCRHHTSTAGCSSVLARVTSPSMRDLRAADEETSATSCTAAAASIRTAARTRWPSALFLLHHQEAIA